LGIELLAEGRSEAVEVATVEHARSASISDVGPIFERLCGALGQPIPPVDEAIDIVTTAILREIVNGSVAPEVGLQRLMDDVYDPHVSTETDLEYVGESRGLQDLIGTYWSYSELRERPNELSIEGRFGEAAIPLLDQQACQLANEWLNTHTSSMPS
jgi:hypothetical protein